MVCENLKPTSYFKTLEEDDMKATGIVRRIDDLGRVVVPKEIRRTLRIREGDPLEIFTDREGEIILKKYSPLGELSVFAKQYAESLAQTTGHMVCVTDRDTIVATAGGAKKDYYGKAISPQLEHLIQERESLQASAIERKFIPVIQEEMEGIATETICPVISEGDAIGAVILLGRDIKVRMGEVEQKVAAVAAGCLGRQMEQ